MIKPDETNNVVERLRSARNNIEVLRDEDNFPAHLLGATDDLLEAADDFLAIGQSLSDRIDVLDAECERAWESYRIAVDQAMANGQALADLRASLTQGGKNG